MSDAQRARGFRTWIAGVSAAALVLGAAVAASAGAETTAPSAQAGVCEPTTPGDANAEAAELIRSIAEARPDAAAPDADEDGIALNNRGYNYGPAPGVRFDLHPLDHTRRAQQAPDAR